MSAFKLAPLTGLVRERIARNTATGSLPTFAVSSTPEESKATRRPRFLIQMRLTFAAKSTSEESLFLASKVPGDIDLTDSINTI